MKLFTVDTRLTPDRLNVMDSDVDSTAATISSNYLFPEADGVVNGGHLAGYLWLCWHESLHLYRGVQH